MAVPQEVLRDTPASVIAPLAEGDERILCEDALAFVAALHRRFEGRRQAQLRARGQHQARYDAGALPDFRADTQTLRQSDWQVAPIPPALQDRRVEITGPVERKMIINALNSGANVFMADFEDSSAPTWRNQLDGQINLRDAVRERIEFVAGGGRTYRVNPDPAILMVRPRGWHLDERHVQVDGEAVSGALVDFGLFVFHNARELCARDRGPYFYLAKLESMEEAALWDDVMRHAEEALDLPAACIKATVLIETLPAALQMDEILHALRTRVVGLNCGRWDYIFSYLKTLRAHRSRVLPERGQIGMGVPFLRAYSQLLIKTCHHRGALAMGGMAAQVPIRGDEEANSVALAKVRADKLREVRDGHDGTWVAHPALVAVAREVFDAHMPTRNQVHVKREDVHVSRDQLLAPCAGTITRVGFDNNVEVALRYLTSWLQGQGCVPIHHLMEDAATAEIARTQLWRWLHHADPQSDGSPPRAALELDDHAPIDLALFEQMLATHVHRLRTTGGTATSRLDDAAGLLRKLVQAPVLAEFLTVPAYQQLG